MNWISHNPNNDPTFQIYANSEIMLERSQSFIAKNTVHVRKVSNVIDEVWITNKILSWLSGASDSLKNYLFLLSIVDAIAST